MKIIIVGKSASGKDYFKKLLQKKGLKLDISYTTRKRRDHETDGVHYNFVSDDEFRKLVDDKKMVQWQDFNGSKYGTHIDMWNECDVFIMNVSGLRQLTPELRQQAMVYYMNIHEHDRFVRMLARDHDLTLDAYNHYVENKNKDIKIIEKSIHDRINADETEYKCFDDYDVEIVNPNFLHSNHL